MAETQATAEETAAPAPAPAKAAAKKPAPEPVASEPAGYPEPTLVGHQIVQDNVTEPGKQHTKTPSGEITTTTKG